MKTYDLIIIGSGPAGITAGIYAKNFGLDCLIIGQEAGGLINTAHKVDNYPGIFNISGKDLTKEFEKHRKHLKVELKKERVEMIDNFKVFTHKNQYQAKSLILAFGTEQRKLNIVNKFEGKGVSYRMDDNTFLYKNKTIAVVGGANAAVMSTVALSEKAKKIYLIYRKENLRADNIWINKVKKLKNVEVIYKANIAEIKGKSRLERIILDNGKTLEISSLLIEAGTIPSAYLIKKMNIRTNKQGYIKVEKDQSTNIKGIFAAGDITTNSNEFRQITTACPEGAVAVLGVFNYLRYN